MSLTAWRIIQVRHAGGAFSGEGARRFGGRWNHRGTPLVYTSQSIALAALELLAHLDDPKLLERYVCIPAEFGEELVRQLPRSKMPRDWQRFPPPVSTKNIGTDWARGLGSAVLAVPSVIVPAETNYLVNPAHRDFRKIRIGKPIRFAFDARLRTPR
jgi:RES domain-containing protein